MLYLSTCYIENFKLMVYIMLVELEDGYIMATESFTTNIIFNHTDALIKALKNNQKPNLTEFSAEALRGKEEVSNFVRQLKESKK